MEIMKKIYLGSTQSQRKDAVKHVENSQHEDKYM